MGKYKYLTPAEVANNAWNNLVSKTTQMIDNYTRAISNLPADASARGRYTSTVQLWTEIMRSGDIKARLSQAVSEAKARLLQRKGVTAVAVTR